MIRLLLPRVRVVTLATLFAACSHSSGTNPDGLPVNGAASVDVTPTVTQSVSVTPSSPVSGTNITVRSVLINRGTTSAALLMRICGLDYAGTLSLTHPPEILKCAGHSHRPTLAPGDSIVNLDYMRVASPAGTYTLRARHALQPEAWAELQLQVR